MGKPQANGAKRPRVIDQRLEVNRLDFAEYDRCSNDKLCAVRVRADDVTQRWPALWPLAWFRSDSRPREDRLRALTLDQRPHPPRRRLANVGERDKCEAKPSRDINRLLRRALRSQNIVAREIHSERTIARRFKADVRVDVAEREAPLRVEDEAELRR